MPSQAAVVAWDITRRLAGREGTGMDAQSLATRGLPRSWVLTLAGLLVARVLVSALPGMWFWGFNVQRFVHPAAAAVGLLAVAVVMLPAIGQRCVPSIAKLGDMAMGSPWIARGVWAAIAVGTVCASPDRTHFTGDFYLRELAVRIPLNPAAMFPRRSRWMCGFTTRCLCGLSRRRMARRTRRLGPLA